MESPTAPTTEDIESTETAPASASDDSTVIESELLVEEISIDGMCGVY
ncbi:MAG: mycofactocin precursor MftA [Actinomycetota bacterium]|jgi:mycofactocin precursor